MVRYSIYDLNEPDLVATLSTQQPLRGYSESVVALEADHPWFDVSDQAFVVPEDGQYTISGFAKFTRDESGIIGALYVNGTQQLRTQGRGSRVASRATARTGSGGPRAVTR